MLHASRAAGLAAAVSWAAGQPRMPDRPRPERPPPLEVRRLAGQVDVVATVDDPVGEVDAGLVQGRLIRAKLKQAAHFPPRRACRMARQARDSIIVLDASTFVSASLNANSFPERVVLCALIARNRKRQSGQTLFHMAKNFRQKDTAKGWLCGMFKRSG